MKSSITALQNDVEQAIEFFTSDELAIELPFMRSFPRNCCEVVSALLAEVLVAKYPEEEVVRIAASTASGGEQHFWVEVASKVIDPTSGQFDTVGGPLVCEIPSPLAITFSSTERQTPKVAVNELGTLGISTAVLSDVLKRLATKLGIEP